MHVKRDVIATLALGIGGLLVSSLTASGVAMGIPVFVFGLTALTASTAQWVRRDRRVHAVGPVTKH
jgi:Sec-independent protein secretion pathway component TatC